MDPTPRSTGPPATPHSTEPDATRCLAAYRRLTVPAELARPDLSVLQGLPPLPHLDERPSGPGPLRPSGQDEPLIAVTDAGAADLGAYRAAGWTAGAPTGLARIGAVARLRAAVALLPDGYGLAVFDAWRPLALQWALHHQAYDGTGLEPGFVEEPSPSPLHPPPHLTGGAFDLTLTWQDRPLALGTHFDEFTDRAHTAALELEPGPARDLRRLLASVLLRAGFAPYAAEWWHWEFGTRRWGAFRGREAIYGPAAPAHADGSAGL